ncbi:type II secretion system GspH family protein [Patescibacteria group bacterium]|nr:type II secretion system GspH family protein [Patescibacteria group bacterium]
MKINYKYKQGFIPTPKRRCDGFTIMELLVSMTVFLVVISIASGVFIQALRTQKTVSSLSEAMNNATLAIEQMSREVRTAFNIKLVSGGGLNFINASGRNVTYSLGNGVIQRRVPGEGIKDLTSPDINISSLQFISKSEANPPLITISIVVLAGKDIELQLQTTVSSRLLIEQ